MDGDAYSPRATTTPSPTAPSGRALREPQPTSRPTDPIIRPAGNIGYHRPVERQTERGVLARWQFWTTTLLAILVAVAAGYTMYLFGQNRNAQAQVAQRQQFIQQSVQLEGLYRDIVKGLADLSIRNQDKALGDLLSSQGITVNAPAAPAPAAPDAKKGNK